jgi:hypothetical protein
MSTVGELRALLAKLPADTRVAFMIDAEGNGYKWVLDVETDGLVVKDHSWSPELTNTCWTAEDMGMEEEKWTKMKKENEKVVIICPVN